VGAPGLSGLVGLLELYAAHNCLGNSLEVAGLTQLMVLDLTANPCCQGAEYALQICFHMPTLKVIINGTGSSQCHLPPLNPIIGQVKERGGG